MSASSITGFRWVVSTFLWPLYRCGKHCKCISIFWVKQQIGIFSHNNYSLLTLSGYFGIAHLCINAICIDKGLERLCTPTAFFLPFRISGFGHCCHALIRHVFMMALSRAGGMASARLWFFVSVLRLSLSESVCCHARAGVYWCLCQRLSGL